MSELSSTNTSPIGDATPKSGIYKGYNVHITFAGVIVARARECEFRVDNNLENKYEAGNRHPLVVPGGFECSGTLRGYVFDTSKFKMAVGKSREEVSDTDIDALDGDTFENEVISPSFGSQPWYDVPKFTITLELHIDGEDKYMQYTLKGCRIDNYRVNAPAEGDVEETVTFMAERAGIEMLTA